MTRLTIEAVLDEALKKLTAELQDIVARADRIRAGLDAYVSAVEHDLAGGLAVSLGLVRDHRSLAAGAVRDLRNLVDGLPEARVDAQESTEPKPRPPEPPCDDEADALWTELEAQGNFDGLHDGLFRSWAEEFAARARLVQARLGERDRYAPEVRVIRKLTKLASERGLTDVFGLNRRHEDDWNQRLQHARSERVRLEGHEQGPTRSDVPIPATEGAVDEVDDGSDPSVDVPNLRALDGAAIVLLGGEVDRPKLDRLRKRTGTKLDWIGMEDVAPLARRVREGRVGGIVVLDGLVGHSAIGPVMEASRARRVPVEYGRRAGLSSITAALVALDARLGSVA